MSIDQINSCCGIGEIEGVETDVRVLIAEVYQNHHDEEGYNMYIFSDNVSYTGGRKLAAYIRRMKLGSIIASPVVRNPKHSSRVRLWTWVVNKKNLMAWGKNKNNQSFLDDQYRVGYQEDPYNNFNHY